MARRRRRNKLTVSLFPFLSVLACVIGTLTLMITALALGQMGGEDTASALRLDFIKREIKAYQQRIEALRAKLAGADSMKKRLAETRVELERLKLEKDLLFKENEKEVPKPDVEIPDVDPEAHKKRMEQLAADLKQREELMNQLLVEIKKRKQPPEEAQVTIQPGGSGVDLEPTFVECAASGIVIYEGDPPRRVPRAAMAKDEGFLALLDRIAKQPKGTVIFLVRDDGLGTYYSASATARSHYARNGKLPAIGHGKIDLGLFKK